MSDEIVQPSTQKALIAAVETGGEKEITALTKELDGLSRMQLEAVGQFLPLINDAEAKIHPGLPALTLETPGGGNSSGYTSQEFSIMKQDKTGEPAAIYHREFETDNDLSNDIKFNPLTHKVASMDVTSPTLPPMHIVVHPSDGK
jgi:hypothetical protein